ncbi:MAG: hypothetical protein CM1200mP10_16950 [Candidatus Neomarinimicrobiota bacterium]|nr:MAG: hypothetical protein CM1200mP10_16950 [Candidatus Neomarinimicrobiota bacterium]
MHSMRGNVHGFPVKFDFTSQFNKNNLLKTGIDYTDYSVWARNYSDVLNSRRLHYIGYHHRTGIPGQPKQFAWYIQDKMEYKGLVSMLVFVWIILILP